MIDIKICTVYYYSSLVPFTPQCVFENVSMEGNSKPTEWHRSARNIRKKRLNNSIDSGRLTRDIRGWIRNHPVRSGFREKYRSFYTCYTNEATLESRGRGKGGGRRRRRRRGLYLIKPPGAELIEHQYPVVLWLIESPADVDCIISLLNSSPSVLIESFDSSFPRKFPRCNCVGHWITWGRSFRKVSEKIVDFCILEISEEFPSMLDRHLTRDLTVWIIC